jgi:uncharacterized tellurite resistance protein B-like protein
MPKALTDWVKQLFQDESTTAHDSVHTFSDETLAACALLLEVTFADHAEEPEEIKALQRAMAKRFGITDEAFDTLLHATRAQAKDAVSLYEHTRVLNDELDHRAKIDLVELMWDIAHADGQLDHYEEHLIRRVAELLYVEHADFILAKIASKERNA